MGISRIQISNYKSIKNMKLDFAKNNEEDLYCMIGKNGTGKTTVIDAINYFYNVANNENYIENVIDRKNIYTQKMSIEIIFDFTSLKEIRTNPYIEETLKFFKKYISNDKLLIKLTQYKNGERKWYPRNDSYFVKRILKIFPVFIINTRFISLTDWSDIWDRISEISISGVNDESEINENKLQEAFDTIYGEKFLKSVDAINKIFVEENIKINNRDYLSRYNNAIKTQLGGNNFLTNENNLQYYSDGINSLQYLKLYLKLVVELSKMAWKNSLIIIDEPEIGLHPKFVEDLADLLLINKSKKVSILITTHSSHLVSSIINNNMKVCFFRIYMDKGYSKIERPQNIINERDALLINDAEAESFFADIIIFVEGQTEIQVFKNKNIQALFPELKRTTIYNTNSTDSITKLISPQNTKFNISYLNILDMDKILRYEKKDKKFCIKGNSFNPLYNKNIINRQKFMFYNDDGEKFYTHNLYQRIKGMLKSYQVKTEENKFWIDDKKFNYLQWLVRYYCYKYNVFLMSTTIEGAVVNSQSYNMILKWLEKKVLSQQDFLSLKRLLEKEDHRGYKISILRIIMNGKLDNLELFSSKNDMAEDVFKEIEKLKGKTGGKVDGWITSFFEFYFENLEISILDERRKKFYKDFPELGFILQKIEEYVKI